MGFFKSLWTELWESHEPLPEEEDMPEDNVPQELKDAEARCPDVKFVQSCRAFYEKRGFLSAAQRNALRYTGTKNRRRNYSNGYEPEVDQDTSFDDVHDFDRE
jgi:hypothetical protein